MIWNTRKGMNMRKSVGNGEKEQKKWVEMKRSVGNGEKGRKNMLKVMSRGGNVERKHKKRDGDGEVETLRGNTKKEMEMVR